MTPRAFVPFAALALALAGCGTAPPSGSLAADPTPQQLAGAVTAGIASSDDISQDKPFNRGKYLVDTAGQAALAVCLKIPNLPKPRPSSDGAVLTSHSSKIVVTSSVDKYKDEVAADTEFKTFRVDAAKDCLTDQITQSLGDAELQVLDGSQFTFRKYNIHGDDAFAYEAKFKVNRNGQTVLFHGFEVSAQVERFVLDLSVVATDDTDYSRSDLETLLGTLRTRVKTALNAQPSAGTNPQSG